LVEYIDSGASGAVDIRKDADALRDYIKAEGVALVYFDQLLDNLGSNTDSWKDKDVRDTIAPLRRIAQETDCALLCSMHPNKRGGSFRDRISGTAAFNALSRSSMIVASHPDEDGRVVVVRAKGNYSVEPPAFEFRIEEETLTVAGRTITTSRITSIRETGLRWADLLDATATRRQPDSDASRAKAMVSELFSNGEVRRAADVLEHMEAEGFSKRVTQRARQDLGIRTWKDGYQGPQVWGWGPKPKAKRRVVRGSAKAQ
jgi:hypothetical protein